MPMAVASMAATVLTIELPSAQMRRPLLGFGSEHELPRLPPYISKKQTLKIHTVPAPSTNCNGTSSPSLRAADQIGGRCRLRGGTDGRSLERVKVRGVQEAAVVRHPPVQKPAPNKRPLSAPRRPAAPDEQGRMGHKTFGVPNLWM